MTPHCFYMVMDEEEYEDYLVDKAKELMQESLETDEEKLEKEGVDKPEMRKKQNKKDEKVEKDSTSKIPFSWDPREIKYLAENRPKMSNEELKKFFEKDTDLHEELEKSDDWKGFSRWEERFIVQNNNTMDEEEIAEQIGRDVREVNLKMRIMGLKVE